MMAETTPNYGNADSYSAEASATIKARNCLEVSGTRTVAPTAGPGGAFAGVAAYDVPKGELVTVRTTGVHTLRCSGSIPAGARVTTAASGTVAVGEPAIGVTQGASVGGMVKVKLIAAAGGGASAWADVHAAAEKATPVDGDDFALMDSAATWGLKRITFGSLKARLLDYVSTAAATFSNKTLTSPTINAPRITGGTYDNVTGAVQSGTTSESIGTVSRIAVMTHVSTGSSTASAAVLPELHNALAYHLMRGGTVRVTVNGVDKTSSVVGLDNAFAPNSVAAEIPVQATTDVVVIEVDLSAYREGDPNVGVLQQPIIGAEGRSFSFARSVALEVYEGSTWTQIGAATNANGQFAAWSGNKFPPKIRWTFTTLVNPAALRINSLFAISVSDNDAGFSGFFPRGGGRLYGSTAKPPAVTASGKDSAIPLVIGGKNADVTTPDGAIFTTLVPMPASGTAAGRRGMIAFAADGLSAVVCVTSGAAGAAVWKRITLAAF